MPLPPPKSADKALITLIKPYRAIYGRSGGAGAFQAYIVIYSLIKLYGFDVDVFPGHFYF